MTDEIKLTPRNDRGFVATDETLTDYGSTVRFGESSSAEGPKLWMWTEQPPPQYGGQLEQGSVSTHMTLEQAREIHAKLGRMIEFTEKSWGVAPGEPWNPEEEE